MNSSTSADKQDESVFPDSSLEPAARLQAVHDLGANAAERQAELEEIALSDADSEIRCAAIGYLQNPASLDRLLQESGNIQDVANQQLLKLVADTVPNRVPAAERLGLIAGLDPKSLKQVALLTKDKSVAGSTVELLTDSQELADLCLFAASVHVRRAAAEKIQDPDLISELLSKVNRKDKTVTRVLSDKHTTAPPAALSIAEREDSEVAGKAFSDEFKAALAAHLETCRNLPELLGETEIQHLVELAGSLPAGLEQVRTARRTDLAPELLKFSRLLAASSYLSRNGTAIAQLLDELGKLGHRNTGQLNTLKKHYRKTRSELAWPRETPVTESFQALLAAEDKLTELTEKNQRFQAELFDVSCNLVESLKLALEAGNSSEAGAIWDKLNGNLNNLSGSYQQQLRQQTAEFRGQINELRGWKKFAATEKKKELIQQMQHLLEEKMHLPDKARQINKLHEAWKQLGFSSQNEKLWRQFKKVSDEAYAPCREFFKQQKAQMAENFSQRTRICEQLDAFLAELDLDSTKLVDLKKIEDQARDDWKRYAPVEQAKVKKLQKRFYGLLNRLRDIRRNAAKENGRLKQELVQQARQLVELEDRQQAMAGARELQARWKTIGPSFFKDDRQYWTDFRAACDAIFKERDEARQEVRREIATALKSTEQILQSLEQIWQQDDESFREAKKQFTTLQREFQEALSPRVKKERQQLMSHFNSLCRKIDARFRRLPDRKLLKSRAALEARAAFCLELENRLLACQDDKALQQVVASVEGDSWQQLDSSGIEQFDRAMDARLQSLQGLASCSALTRLVQDAEQCARRRVVGAEIRASLDSPERDKGLRMELQLNQLQKNFGKAAFESTAEKDQFLRDFLLDMLCLGPLSEAVRNELEPRADRVSEKLL